MKPNWSRCRGVLAAAALLLAAQPGTASERRLRAMARDLGRAAQRAGLPRIAVLPFTPTGGGAADAGLELSEKLLTQLVRSGRVQAVERSHLPGVLREHSLALSGALDPAGARRLGRLLAADAVVTGSFVSRGTELLVQARLVNVESGVVIGAAEGVLTAAETALQRLERDPWDLPVPELLVAAPPASFGAPDTELRDAMGSGCDDAVERVDRLERRILDLKARYWAGRLRAGLSLSSLRFNPGSTISDPNLKREFYAKLARWHRSPEVPALDAGEARLFTELDGRAFALHRECGL